MSASLKLPHAYGVCPPQVRGSIQKQATEQNGRQISAKLCLFCIRVQGGTSESVSHSSFCLGEQGHYGQRHASQNDSRHAVFRGPPRPQVRNGFVGDVNCQHQEAGSYNPQRPFFVEFSAVYLRIYRQPPEQSQPRRNFDETVESETDERDAAGGCPSGDCNPAFDGIPPNGKVFEPPPTSYECRASYDFALAHRASLPNFPKTMRKQIGDAEERLPTCRCASKPVVETHVKDQIFPGRVAHSPKISNRVALQEWLSEMPDFSRQRESM